MPDELIEASAPVAVIGAGTMGVGIAQVAAVAGHPVLVYDAAPEAAERPLTPSGCVSPRRSPRAVSMSTRLACGWTWPAHWTNWRRPGAWSRP